MNQWVWWVLSVVVPCAAMIGYWLIARRQVSRATAGMRAELDQQRRIVARVSHRLRDSLTVVYGFSETLVDTTMLTNTDEIVNAASMVNAEALDASRTVEDLVTAQEVDSGELQMRRVGFDPSEEIETAVTPFRRLGSPISVEAWSGTATSDPLRFRHIVQSLVSNAVRYGGSEISIYADLDGDWYRCTVADDGEGLSDDVAGRLFADRAPMPPSASNEDSEGEGDEGDSRPPDPLPPMVVDATGTNDGLGLGLAVARRIAQLLGGALTYEHAPEFTAFTLSLPTKGWPGPLVPLYQPTADDLEPDPDPDDEPTPSDEQESAADLRLVTFDDAGTIEARDESLDDDRSVTEATVDNSDQEVTTP